MLKTAELIGTRKWFLVGFSFSWYEMVVLGVIGSTS
jgi:hypothetical protein